MKSPFFGQTPKSFRLLRFLYHLPNFVKLAWRLFWDARVPIYRKAILVIFEVLAFVFAVVYFLFLRLDFLPDILPILGYTDDLLIGIFLILVPGAWLFIKLSPEHIVQEHVDQISKGN
jgi:uncharacterized membrane protein YkvA (DUF1232 family)